jgi:mRNA interferase MazF
VARGDIWTIAGGPDYAGKPRPAVILQDNQFAGLESVTICALTSDLAGEDVVRLAVNPNDENGLRQPSRLMVDKITTIPRSKLGRQIGRLRDEDMAKLSAAVMIFLGLAR